MLRLYFRIPPKLGQIIEYKYDMNRQCLKYFTRVLDGFFLSPGQNGINSKSYGAGPGTSQSVSSTDAPYE